MKRLITIIALLGMLSCLCSCGQGNVAKGDSNQTANAEQKNVDQSFSPYDSTVFQGISYTQAESKLREAGFEKIVLTALDDIDSNSNIEDGAVETVTIGGVQDYLTTTPFHKADVVIISYHNIPKNPVPVTSATASTIP